MDSRRNIFLYQDWYSTQSLPGVYYSSAGWADYNNDELLDLVLTGVTFSGPSVTNLYKSSGGLLYQDLNQEMNSFLEAIYLGLTILMMDILDLSLTGFQISDYFGGREEQVFINGKMEFMYRI